MYGIGSLIEHPKYKADFMNGIAEKLPHGSGIDCDWEIEDKGNYIRCDNSYHYMNDNGMYMGYLHFYVIVPKTKPVEFRLYFSVDSTGRYWVNRLGLAEYLSDTISLMFSE